MGMGMGVERRRKIKNLFTFLSTIFSTAKRGKNDCLERRRLRIEQKENRKKKKRGERKRIGREEEEGGCTVLCSKLIVRDTVFSSTLLYIQMHQLY